MKGLLPSILYDSPVLLKRNDGRLHGKFGVLPE
jgi:hypothetical protein